MTAVVERNSTFQGEFETEPYEVGWAREARWFIRPLEIEGRDVRVDVRTEVSPDGLHWCLIDDEMRSLDAESGMISWPVREFGGWLRISGVVSGDDASLKTMICLSIKS